MGEKYELGLSRACQISSLFQTGSAIPKRVAFGINKGYGGPLERWLRQKAFKCDNQLGARELDLLRCVFNAAPPATCPARALRSWRFRARRCFGQVGRVNLHPAGMAQNV